MPINFDWFDLSPYTNKYFVETGFFHGEGAMKALSSGMFEQVISIEVNDDLVQRAQDKFRLPIVAGLLKVVQDDSSNLWKHIEEIDAPITFFLDAHGYWIHDKQVAAATATTATIAAPSTSSGNAANGAAEGVVADASTKDQDPAAQNPCPLIQELEAIARHPLASKHTVLIDDRRCLQPGWEHPTQSWWQGLSEDLILEKLRAINPNFVISYADGLEKDDIIVAVPPSR
eukprot:TRINITY_DN24993_c0_g1_i1.p1 TRINITY_DN24993_c0_g1~~TRINITY_DN24993_c0_g1_i1.p1  ORF type:complete len:230 (+),score=50.67 TRINITY_DN24993_c0_g1_i1:62-751(+)